MCAVAIPLISLCEVCPCDVRILLILSLCVRIIYFINLLYNGVVVIVHICAFRVCVKFCRQLPPHVTNELCLVWLLEVVHFTVVGCQMTVFTTVAIDS